MDLIVGVVAAVMAAVTVMQPGVLWCLARAPQLLNNPCCCSAVAMLLAVALAEAHEFIAVQTPTLLCTRCDVR